MEVNHQLKNLSKLLFISLIIHIFGYVTNHSFLHVIGCLLISIMFIMISINFFYTAFFIDSLLLIIMPYFINKYHTLFLSEHTTYITIIIVCWLFIISIINFLILAYNIKGKPSETSIVLLNSFQKLYFFRKYNSIFRIIIFFSLYIIILYSVLSTFGILYSYLSKIFHEGIEGEQILTTKLDALYFSATTFFTIGLGDFTPSKYSEITKILVIVQALLGHLITTVLWPIVIIFMFTNKKKISEVLISNND